MLVLSRRGRMNVFGDVVWTEAGALERGLCHRVRVVLDYVLVHVAENNENEAREGGERV